MTCLRNSLTQARITLTDLDLDRKEGMSGRTGIKDIRVGGAQAAEGQGYTGINDTWVEGVQRQLDGGVHRY